MKKLVLSLSTFALIAASIFVFASCEKEEKSILQKNAELQLVQTFCNTSTPYNEIINITTLADLPQIKDFMHIVSTQFAVFSQNVESSDDFIEQINKYCNNIHSSNNLDSTALYYSLLSQSIFPINGLDIVNNNNVSILYTPKNHIQQLYNSYHKLSIAISNTLPEFEGMSEEMKIQILALAFEKNMAYEQSNIGGPLENERDDKIIRATIAYAITLATCLENPFIVAAATTLYCREIKAAWREYYKKGGKEPKGISCKICDM